MKFQIYDVYLSLNRLLRAEVKGVPEKTKKKSKCTFSPSLTKVGVMEVSTHVGMETVLQSNSLWNLDAASKHTLNGKISV